MLFAPRKIPDVPLRHGLNGRLWADSQFLRVSLTIKPMSKTFESHMSDTMLFEKIFFFFQKRSRRYSSLRFSVLPSTDTKKKASGTETHLLSFVTTRRTKVRQP